MTPEYKYVGEELDVFSLARNWKNYWGSLIRPYLGKHVLEVGAGIGANTELLCSSEQERWISLEPDESLSETITERLEQHPYRHIVDVRVGSIGSISLDEKFDSILYIDVLEHIQDDRRELELASKLLKSGGTLIVLAPAHQRLYSPFDRSVGHFRRYSIDSLLSVGPPSLNVLKLIYVDAAGLLASSANLLYLRQSLPTAGQIRFWDRYLVPLSARIDPWLRFRLGKTVLGFWRKA